MDPYLMCQTLSRATTDRVLGSVRVHDDQITTVHTLRVGLLDLKPEGLLEAEPQRMRRS